MVDDSLIMVKAASREIRRNFTGSKINKVQHHVANHVIFHIPYPILALRSTPIAVRINLRCGIGNDNGSGFREKTTGSA